MVVNVERGTSIEVFPDRELQEGCSVWRLARGGSMHVDVPAGDDDESVYMIYDGGRVSGFVRRTDLEHALALRL